MTKRNTNKNGTAGAPLDNTNARRHGLRCGKVPVGARHVEHAANALRRVLEGAVLDLKNEISIVDAASINTAAKWEVHGGLGRLWLRKQIHELSPTDRLKFSEAIAKASDHRDRAIRLLGLDKTPETINLATYMENKQ